MLHLFCFTQLGGGGDKKFKNVIGNIKGYTYINILLLLLRSLLFKFCSFIFTNN